MYVMLFVIFAGYCQGTLHVQPGSNCLKEKSSLFKIHIAYFSETKDVKILLLQSQDNSKEDKYFLDEYLWYFNSRYIWHKSINIQSYSLFGRRRRNAIGGSKGPRRTEFGDPEQGYIIIVRDEIVLKQYLKRNFSFVFPKPRASYLFVFSEKNWNGSLHRYDEIISLLWNEYDILNVLAIAPCSYNFDRVFLYKPFDYDEPNHSWGLVHSYSTDYVVVNPQALFNTMDDFKGYPISVSTFTRIPTNMPYPIANIRYDCSYGNLIFGGLDGCVMKYMSKILNFKFNIVGPIDNEKFGYKAPNGTFLGSLGDIVYRRAQITGNSRFLEVFDREQYEFTLPIKNDQICFVVPKAYRIPQWVSLYNCFSSETWTALIIVMIFMCVLYYFSTRISFHLLLRSKMSNFKDTFNIIGLFLNVPMHKLPKIHHERMIVISSLMFNIIILGTFQGSLFTSFSSILYYPDINTLEELSHSNLLIATSLDPFHGDESRVIKKIYSKHIDLLERALTRAALKRDVAAMERKEDANFYIQIEYISSDGVPLLHVVAECPTSNFLAYIVPKDSPFLPRFNALLIRFLESGLIEKWYYDTVEATILSKKYAKNQTSNSQEPLELQDLQSAFYFLFVGVAMAAIIFTIEIICKLLK